jgi:arsenate reductase
MSATVFGLKNCDTCRRALRELEDAGIDHTFFDIRTGGLSQRHVARWVAALGIDLVLNKRSTTWRNLPDLLKQNAETEPGVVDLMFQHPTLIKRPMIESDGKALVGWNGATRAALGVGS